METLLDLFKENYKPCAISPIRSLHETFIYKQGFTQNDIENLLKNNIIEKSGMHAYKFTDYFIKDWKKLKIKY